MYTKPMVSIIIPVYNVEKYLNQCVDSIISQDYENKEIILVDDGSTDSSGTICDEYSNKFDYIKTIHKSNGGLSDARNTGIDNANGDYILFVDSDDYIEQKSLDKIMKIASENECDVVFLEAQKVFTDGKKLPLGDGITTDGVIGKTRNEVLKFIASCPKYPASACTKLIKKSLLDNPELKFKKGVFSEDIDWTISLLLSCRNFGCCPDMYYNYRQNREGSITNTNASKRLKDLYYIVDKWSVIAKEKTDSEKQFIMSELAYEYPMLLLLYSSVSEPAKKEYGKKLSDLKYILKCRNGLKYKMIYILCTYMGIGITSKVIRWYIRRR